MTAVAIITVLVAADWQHGSPGTEQLRLSLRRYRAFIGGILPK